MDLTRLKYAFDYYCSSQQPFASQIYSLKLSDECDRLTLVNRHMDISLFKNLRALTIRKSSPENLNKILSKFHSLSNLHYLNIYATLIQSPYITARLFSIRSLKRLILHSFDPILLHLTDNAICSWTKLEYLELNSCYMIHFLELLKYIGPNVKRMAITILYKRREDPASIDPAIIDNLLYGDGGHPQIPEPPTLEVYTYSQSAHNRKYAVEFYGKQRYMKTTSNTIDVDKNITKLKITLHDNVEQLVLTNQSRTIYPNVTIITIHSQMTTRPKENDPISRCDK
ncbi:unnamed protein product [Rotaria sp. Silwood1]|nr:unnamed protein product [Rotaria sp. Silwood1]CAF0996919.1 unnamed protein product [Rotaria sp. Silwood1]